MEPSPSKVKPAMKLVIATIHRVPKELRQGNEQFYDPKVISIGPYHANSPNLQEGMKMKRLYLNFFISRTEWDKDGLHQMIKTFETKFRDRYADHINLSSTEFMEMVLIDAGFILELLWRHENVHKLKENNDPTLIHDPIFIRGRARWSLLHNIQEDLLLLENQIPFSVLIGLHRLAFGRGKDIDTSRRNLIESITKFFSRTFPNDRTDYSPNKQPAFFHANRSHAIHNHFCSPVKDCVFIPLEETDDEMFTHLLEFVWWFDFRLQNVPSVSKQSTKSQKFFETKSATELELYGIKFAGQQAQSVSELQFKNGAFKMPRLVFRPSTSPLFWNLLALEQIDSVKPLCFTSYVILMNSLVHTDKDVDLLCRSGVIRSRVDDLQEVVKLFKGLASNIMIENLEDFYFRKILHEVDNYCYSGMRPLRGYLVRNYYDVRWDVLNSFLLFILTCTQTIYSVLSYNSQQK